MKIIAFDIGTKRVGVAASDPQGLIASPLQVCERSHSPEADARALAELACAQEAERIVVGMPVSLRGKEEVAAQQVREFVGLLSEHAEVEVVVWDERMTTVIAERAMISADVSRAERRSKIDQVAAAVILQSYLDAQRSSAEERSAERA